MPIISLLASIVVYTVVGFYVALYYLVRAIVIGFYRLRAGR